MRDLSRLELRQLRQFVAVAEARSLRGAAQRLNMTQPPLTQAIQRLEQTLDVALIERGSRGIRLTAAGLAFLEEARRTLAQATRAIDTARRAGRGLIGSLRVTFVGSASYELLPQALRAFRRRHGEVALELREATTAQQIEALDTGRADLGIVVPPVATAGLTLQPIRRDPLVAALPTRHPLAARRRLRLADLATEPFILFPAAQGPGFHARILAACRLAGFAPRVVQEAHQMHTIVGLVAGGLGVALVPRPLARLRLSGAVFRPIVGADLDYELALAWRPEAASPVLDAFRVACATTRGASI